MVYSCGASAKALGTATCGADIVFAEKVVVFSLAMTRRATMRVGANG